jgi:hypothetical protein
VLFFVSSRQGQIFIRRLLCLLYETVKQHHSIFCVDIEQDPSNPIVRKVRREDALSERLRRGQASWGH